MPIGSYCGRGPTPPRHGGDRTPAADTVFQILDADSIAGLGIMKSSGIVDISGLVGYAGGCVLHTSGMGSVADQLAMLVSPCATKPRPVVTVDIASGARTRRRAGTPPLSGTTPTAKTGQGALVLDQVNPLSGSLSVRCGTLMIAHAVAARSAIRDSDAVRRGQARARACMGHHRGRPRPSCLRSAPAEFVPKPATAGCVPAATLPPLAVSGRLIGRRRRSGSDLLRASTAPLAPVPRAPDSP